MFSHFFAIMLVLIGPSIPAQSPAEKPFVLPVLSQLTSNEIMIGDNFNDNDPSMIIGSIFNLRTKTISSFENYLKANPKISRTPKAEVLYRDFIEDSRVGSIAWLSFLEGQVNVNSKAEVTIIKTGVVSIDQAQIDLEKMGKTITSLIDSKPRADVKEILVSLSDLVIITSYTDYVFTSSLYKFTEKAGSIGTFVKIGGRFFKNAESTRVAHRVIATCSPLPTNLIAVSILGTSRLTKTTNLGDLKDIDIDKIEKSQQEALKKFNAASMGERIGKVDKLR